MKNIKKQGINREFEKWKMGALKNNYEKLLKAGGVSEASITEDLLSNLGERNKWKNIKNHKGKAELKASLYKEQGGICCFCGKKLSQLENPEIEHLQPKSLYKRLQFDYYNLVLSCSGNRNGISTERHCNNFKKSEILNKNPVINEEWENTLLYDISGNIRPRYPYYKSVIDDLNLNCLSLKNKRRSAIKGFLCKIEKFEIRGQIKYRMAFNDKLDEKMLEKIAVKINNKDNNGEYYPYCKAISDSLKFQTKKIELKKISNILSSAEENYKKKLKKFLEIGSVPQSLKDKILDEFMN